MFLMIFFSFHLLLPCSAGSGELLLLNALWYAIVFQFWRHERNNLASYLRRVIDKYYFDIAPKLQGSRSEALQ
ncbi:MAG: hypothetical protein D3909_08670 [Candidatus Electrothrix sp. ATG1]|nr:hypothetical protein [Candidatus Electrothrix sp. ATG1]